MVWFTADINEALIIDDENEARCLLHEMQIRYPLKDFTVCAIKE